MLMIAATVATFHAWADDYVWIYADGKLLVASDKRCCFDLTANISADVLSISVKIQNHNVTAAAGWATCEKLALSLT